MTPDNEMPIVLLDAVQSLNYVAPVLPSPFSQSGTLIDLHNGTITTPGLHVDGTTGDVQIRGDVTAEAFELLSTSTPNVVLDEFTFPSTFDGSLIPAAGLKSVNAGPYGHLGYVSYDGSTIAAMSLYAGAATGSGEVLVTPSSVYLGASNAPYWASTVSHMTLAANGSIQVRAATDINLYADGGAGNITIFGQCNLMPPGTIITGVWDTAPPGFFLLNGQTLPNAQTFYPALWAVAPVAWRTGSDLVLPNMTNRVPLATTGAVGVLAGSNTHTLTAANLPAHAHTINHAHAEAGRVNGHIPGRYLQRKGGSGPDWDVQPTGLTRWESITNPATTTFSGNSGNGPGTAAAVTHTPAHMTVRMAIKA